jgi:hypothetical protein
LEFSGEMDSVLGLVSLDDNELTELSVLGETLTG